MLEVALIYFERGQRTRAVREIDLCVSRAQENDRRYIWLESPPGALSADSLSHHRQTQLQESSLCTVVA